MKKRNYAKRDPIKNYFPLPNEIYSLGLSAGEIAVYGYLLYLENRNTYQCWPAYKTIGRAVKLSVNSVRKYVQRLVERGLITTQPTKVRLKDGTARNGTLLYTILPIQPVIDQFHEQQLQQLDLEREQQRVANILREREQTQLVPCEPT